MGIHGTGIRYSRELLGLPVFAEGPAVQSGRDKKERQNDLFQLNGPTLDWKTPETAMINIILLAA